MKCAYCEAEGEILTKDHITPTSNGGLKLHNNTARVCYFCNSLKADMLPLEFIRTLNFLIDKNIATANFKVPTLKIIRKNFQDILKTYKPILQGNGDGIRLRLRKERSGCHTPFNNFKDKIEIKSKISLPNLSLDCKWIYEIDMFRQQEGDDGYWETERRYYRYSKALTDFDLCDILLKRKNAKFIGMKMNNNVTS